MPLKVINDRNTLCTPLTHQSAVTRLAMMTGVCFVPSPSPRFLPQHCNQRPFAPSCICVSFISAYITVTVFQMFQSHLTSCSGVKPPLPSVCSLSFSLSPENVSYFLILGAIKSSLGVTALSYPAPSLPTSSHVREVTGHKCRSTVDEQPSVS